MNQLTVKRVNGQKGRAAGPAPMLLQANAAAKIVARIGEVVLWISSALYVLLVAVFLFSGDRFHLSPDADARMDVGDWHFSIGSTVLDYDIRLVRFGEGPLDLPVVVMVGLTDAIIFALLALVFHEVAALCGELGRWGGAADSGDGTPFSPAAAIRLNRVGWYLIAAPAVAFVLAVICALLGCSFSAGLWMSALMVMLGIIVLQLARVFAYGTALQQDVDGLL